MNPDFSLSRLAREFQRLYLTVPPQSPDGVERVRALVLELIGPAAWQPLAAVWQGVQADLQWPAPAIAVNGTDGLQLWFSLAQPTEAVQAMAVLEGVRQHYLTDVAVHRLSMRAVPAPQPVPRAIDGSAQAEARWSAFVAADLAPVFEDTPWLDLAPPDEGQAELLSRLTSIPLAAWHAAQGQLFPPQPASAAATPLALSGAVADRSGAGASGHPEAKAFLLQLMRDSAAPLALRLEAAKALLPYA